MKCYVCGKEMITAKNDIANTVNICPTCYSVNEEGGFGTSINTFQHDGLVYKYFYNSVFDELIMYNGGGRKCTKEEYLNALIEVKEHWNEVLNSKENKDI